MARTSTYLNFMGKTEEAFEFYRTVFGTSFVSPLQRMSDAPPAPDMPPLSDDDKRKIMHVELPCALTGGRCAPPPSRVNLDGTPTPALASPGRTVRVGG